MIRSTLRREVSSRQLDFFAFAPVAPAMPRPAVVPQSVIPPFPSPISEPARSEPATRPGPFRILEHHRVGVGSPPQKCRDNLAALALLQRLESERRLATSDERAGSAAAACSVIKRPCPSCWSAKGFLLERNPSWLHMQRPKITARLLT